MGSTPPYKFSPPDACKHRGAVRPAGLTVTLAGCAVSAAAGPAVTAADPTSENRPRGAMPPCAASMRSNIPDGMPRTRPNPPSSVERTGERLGFSRRHSKGKTHLRRGLEWRPLSRRRGGKCPSQQIAAEMQYVPPHQIAVGMQSVGDPGRPWAVLSPRHHRKSGVSCWSVTGAGRSAEERPRPPI